MRAFPTSALATAMTLIVGSAWLGCSTTNGEAGEGQEYVPGSGAGKTGGDPPAARPEFDASFEEDDAGPGNVAGDGGTIAECIDDDDPGSAENVAKDLGEISDCNSAGSKVVDGVSKGAADVDFYKLALKDEFGFTCQVNADIGSTTPGLELCVYARCKNMTANAVTGCAAGTEKTSAIGLKGCCAATPGKAIPEWDCSGISDDDSADFFVSVRQTGGNQCLAYKFSYGF